MKEKDNGANQIQGMKEKDNGANQIQDAPVEQADATLRCCPWNHDTTSGWTNSFHHC